MAIKINFTKAEIDALPIPEHGKRDDYQDVKVAGLVLRISYTGVKTYSVLRRIKTGKLERVTLGRYPEMTIDQARRKAMEINVAISEGRNPAEIKRAQQAERTFDDLFTEYIDRHSKHNKKTWGEDVQKYNNHLRTGIGRMKLSDIDRSVIANVHSNITKTGKRISANRTIALISSVFSWAISSGLCEQNPVQGMRRNKEVSRERFIQGDELPRFFRLCSN